MEVNLIVAGGDGVELFKFGEEIRDHVLSFTNSDS
jgi:hypothetical protein